MSRVEVTQFFIDCRGSHFHQINQCAKNGWWGLSLFWQCQDFESACWSNHPSFNVIWGMNVFFARSDVHLFAIGCIFNVCAFEWKRCLWLFATSGSPGWEEAAAALKLCCSLLHRSTLPAQPCTFKLLLLLLLRVLSTGFQSLNNISVLLYSISECKYFVISQMVRGECALRTMRTQWCICWHILLWCGYMQGCINCAILLSYYPG